MDSLFPTLFSKTFFIIGTQLFITWLSTQLLFGLFVRGRDADGKDVQTNLHGMRLSNPSYRWLFSPPFLVMLFVANFALFLTLLYWGIHQSLPISFTLFSLWSIVTGIQLEYTLINIDHGLGRRVLSLTATLVFGAMLIGMYSHVDFGVLQLPLFIALILLLLANIVQILWGLDNAMQRIMALFGVALFTLYLVLDFSTLAEKSKQTTHGWGDSSVDGWSDAMRISIKIYLDIINLFVQLLQAMSKHH